MNAADLGYYAYTLRRAAKEETGAHFHETRCAEMAKVFEDQLKRATAGPKKRIDMLLEEAFDIAIAEVEKRVRTALRNGHKGRNPARSFCMAIGSCSFYDRHGEPLTADFGQKWQWSDPTYNFIGKYDEVLHLTGWPMKIEGPDEPVIHNW